LFIKKKLDLMIRMILKFFFFFFKERRFLQ
jgi:hypothetical protein